MNLLIDLQKVIAHRVGESSPFYLRNLLKEELQNYLLAYVYNQSKYNKLIFTGSTCLRKVYGLNRLSEDLDFDVVDGEFNVEEFAKNVHEYFVSSLGYKEISVRVSSKGETVFFRFPIYKQLQLFSNGTPPDLFVRCDVSVSEIGGYATSVDQITAGSSQFFVLAYDLPTMFANKIFAFFNRVFFQGKFQTSPFKGRDVYDLFWLVQMSAKTGYQLRPRQERLKNFFPDLRLEEIGQKVLNKLKEVDSRILRRDLLPLIEQAGFVDEFVANYQEYLSKNLPLVMNE